MNPIEELANTTFLQALRCVEYRPLDRGTLRGPAYLCAMALRYGLLGLAATHHVLLATASEAEEDAVKRIARHWPDMVQEHFRQHMRSKLPFRTTSVVADTIGSLAFLPIRLEFRLFPQFFPLEQSLLAAAVQFGLDFRDEIDRGSNLLNRNKNRREFYTMSEKSVAFALNFFERRQAELEEVPEIALLGE